MLVKKYGDRITIGVETPELPADATDEEIHEAAVAWANDYLIPTGAAKDEWSVGYTNKYTIACWSGYTTDAITNYGMYITWDDLNVASALSVAANLNS